MERYYSKKNYKCLKSILTTQASTDFEEQVNESKRYRRSEGIDLNSLSIDLGEKLPSKISSK